MSKGKGLYLFDEIQILTQQGGFFLNVNACKPEGNVASRCDQTH
jgi:hypothetical protein